MTKMRGRKKRKNGRIKFSVIKYSDTCRFKLQHAAPHKAAYIV